MKCNDTRDVIAWINENSCLDSLRLVRNAAEVRIQEVAHKDQHGAGAGTREAGYKPLEAATR
jgi:hypothetical protein